MASKPNPAKELEQLIKDVKAKMESRGDGYKEIAAYMGKQYQQAWDWLNFKKKKISGETVLLLQAYVALPSEKEKPAMF